MFDVIHKTLIYIDFKHIRNFDRDDTPKESDTTQNNINIDDSKSYIYSAYNEIQSEMESEGFPKHSTFTPCKFDDVRSQKTDNSKVSTGKLKTEIYQAISYQKTNQNKSSSKAIPIKNQTPLL